MNYGSATPRRYLGNRCVFGIVNLDDLKLQMWMRLLGEVVLNFYCTLESILEEMPPTQRF